VVVQEKLDGKLSNDGYLTASSIGDDHEPHCDLVGVGIPSRHEKILVLFLHRSAYSMFDKAGIRSGNGTCGTAVVSGFAVERGDVQ
jgi:hypothetical protein